MNLSSQQTKMKFLMLASVALSAAPNHLSTLAFSFYPTPHQSVSTSLFASDRRSFLSDAAVFASPLVISTAANAASVPVQRAVGSGESRCRQEGNCLETFEVSYFIQSFCYRLTKIRIAFSFCYQLDGAVGWNWGGTDRCDARDSNW